MYLHKRFEISFLYELNGFNFFYINFWQHVYSDLQIFIDLM